MDNRLQMAAETAKVLFAELGLNELTVKDGDLELVLKKAAPSATPAAGAPASPLAYAPVAPLAGAPVAVVQPTASVTQPTAATPADRASVADSPSIGSGKEVKSPLVGVLYLSPAPQDAPFVAVGDRVAKGDVLCIVEAMKMMNEITSEYEGTILDICAANEELVEYGQVLFKIG